MIKLNTLEFGISQLVNTFYHNGLIKRLYAEKTYFPSRNASQYFLKLCSLGESNNLYCEGYIYFYLDDLKKESTFIGLYVKPECRGTGISSLLISYWLQICMNEGYHIFNTNKKQRKPFLIYLLKKMGFEIEDELQYDFSKYTIDLYRKLDFLEKYLLFKNKMQGALFKNSAVFREDNYVLLDNPDDSFTKLDQVLLSTKYSLKNEDVAYTRSRRKVEEYQK